MVLKECFSRPGIHLDVVRVGCTNLVLNYRIMTRRFFSLTAPSFMWFAVSFGWSGSPTRRFKTTRQASSLSWKHTRSWLSKNCFAFSKAESLSFINWFHCPKMGPLHQKAYEPYHFDVAVFQCIQVDWVTQTSIRPDLYYERNEKEKWFYRRVLEEPWTGNTRPSLLLLWFFFPRS